MTTDSLTSTTIRAPQDRAQLVSYRHPDAEDGAALWRLTAESQILDLNSTYAYVLWSAHFSATSVVAEYDSTPIGYITGYRRPDSPATLMVWQVAVAASARGHGIAAAMLDWLVTTVARPDERLTVETTVGPSNTASMALFTAFARNERVALTHHKGFPAHLFPDAHEPEPLLRIGPLAPRR